MSSASPRNASSMWLSPALLAAAAGAGAVTLADWALIVTIAAGLLSAAWQLVRFYDRIKYGRAAD
jgi:hypothetical protein